MKKVRIDRLLVDRGMVQTRERARALIMAGDVLVDDEPVVKAGTGVSEEADVRLRRPTHPFVGRGGVKLEGALEYFSLEPAGRIALDVGCSTGGFTDCLLQAGAARVYAVDVDTRQLDWKLQNDPRVVRIDGNARYIEPRWIPEPVDLATIDVSFISLEKVVPAVIPVVRAGGLCLCLVKPQFELGRGKVGAGGIVADESLHREAVESVVGCASRIGLAHRGTCPSKITGKEGNQEFFALFEKP